VKRNEQLILASLAAVGLIAAFWMLVLSPKRNEASALQGEIADLRGSLADTQQQVEAGEQARRSYRTDYRKLVVLGKAVPADGEQASLLVQIQRLADESGVTFEAMDLGSESTSAATAAAPSTSTTSTSDSTTSTDASTSSDSSTADSTSTTQTTLATEAAASTLPIGATVGPAGLPVMPYELRFQGGFFEIADFMQRLDGMVHMHDGFVKVNGRLLTVDGFTLKPIDSDLSPTPRLQVDLSVTSFLTPADQGMTGGATPTGPPSAAPTLASSSTTESATTSTSEPTATATAP